MVSLVTTVARNPCIEVKANFFADRQKNVPDKTAYLARPLYQGQSGLLRDSFN
jgi:hypothetical protein